MAEADKVYDRYERILAAKSQNHVRKAFAYTCTYVPVELLYAAGFLPVRISGCENSCSCTDSDLSGNLCPYVHSISAAYKNGRELYAGIAIADSCDAMKSLFQVLSLDAVGNDAVLFLQPPRADDGDAVRMYAEQLRHFHARLCRDRDPDRNALLEAMNVYGEIRALLLRIEDSSPRDVRSRFVRVRAMVLSCDPQRVRSILEAFAEELERPAYLPNGLRVVVCGSPVDSAVSAIEDAGFIIVKNDSCLDLRWQPSADPLKTDCDPYEAIASYYLRRIPCPRMPARRSHIEALACAVKAGEADGIIHVRMPFCDLHGFDFVQLLDAVGNDRIIQIETDGSPQSMAQVHTRIQAFHEILSEGIHTVRGKDTRMKETQYYCGIDIGSTTIDAVIMNGDGRLLASRILKTGPGADRSAHQLYLDMLSELGVGENDVRSIVATGYGRQSLAFATHAITEITCHAKGALHLAPGTRFVIDIGGQDSKVILLEESGKVVNFQMNDKCAAGTGRFLDVMAHALEKSIGELSGYGVEEGDAVPISSVCAVFAESEVVSLIARGFSAPDIARGILLAISRRIEGMARRLGVVEPVLMTGGGALNQGLVKTLSKQLGIDIRVPDHPQLAGAIGAAILGMEQEGLSS